MPIKTVNGATVYLRDVAYVHRGSPPQINAVLVKGKQSVLIEILKSGDASTLSVVAGIKKALPGIVKSLPPGVKITPLNDTSGFVKDSVRDVVQEMVTAALLTGMRDEVLLQLARHPPTTVEALRGLRGLHSSEIERNGEQLIVTITASMSRTTDG